MALRHLLLATLPSKAEPLTNPVHASAAGGQGAAVLLLSGGLLSSGRRTMSGSSHARALRGRMGADSTGQGRMQE